MDSAFASSAAARRGIAPQARTFRRARSARVASRASWARSTARVSSSAVVFSDSVCRPAAGLSRSRGLRAPRIRPRCRALRWRRPGQGQRFGLSSDSRRRRRRTGVSAGAIDAAVLGHLVAPSQRAAAWMCPRAIAISRRPLRPEDRSNPSDDFRNRPIIASTSVQRRCRNAVAARPRGGSETGAD